MQICEVNLVLLNIRQDSKTALGRNQTGNDFLGHVFGGGPQQLFQLNRAELFDDGRLLEDTLLEAFFKFADLAFFLVQVLNQPTSALLHLIEAGLESHPERRLKPLSLPDFLALNWVLRVPNVVRDELLDRAAPCRLQIAISNLTDFFNKPLDILDQDIVSGDEDALLIPQPQKHILLTRGLCVVLAHLCRR